MPETIQPRPVADEMRESYLDYAMSVIIARALPDVRDGLKPVQRRILFTMHEMGLRAAARFRKSAAIVGDCLGKYHPHGDMSVYEAMVRLAQPWSLRYPLVEGQGNLGSIDADAPAAMRYCITGDTLVVTDRGLLPIRALSPEGRESVRFRVLSRDRAVEEAVRWFDSGTHPTLRLTTHRGFTLCGTTNHPVLTWGQDSVTGRPTFHWKLLKDLSVGDAVVIDRTADQLWPTRPLDLRPYWPDHRHRRTIKHALPTVLTEDLAHILGALVAEGTVHLEQIEFRNPDRAWIKEFAARWRRVFPSCPLRHFRRRPSSYGRKTCATMEVHAQHIVEFLRNLGLDFVPSATKVLPPPILRSPKPVVAAFLRAFFEGDGTISGSGKMTELSCLSKSEVLLRDIQVLLLRFGIAATRRYDRYRAIHKLCLRGLITYRLFRDEIGFVSPRKNTALAEAIRRLEHEASLTDFVPYVSTHVRSRAAEAYPLRSFLEKHNFDRYPGMARHAGPIAQAVTARVRPTVAALLERLLVAHYLFDPIQTIEDGGTQHVYSLRIASACHSFVANGFINHNTEAKLARAGELLLSDIEKETAPFVENYDRTRQEPAVLPSLLPNLIVNGTVGIAVGMATNIPPHNLGEVIEALTHLAANPKATVEDLLRFVRGPDFPTGGRIYGKHEIATAYATGRGPIVVRGEAEITETKSGEPRIVITEIPYQVSKASLLEEIAAGVRAKRLEGIRDLRDESDKDGIRVVVELTRTAVPRKVLNQLFAHTALQRTFHVNLLALVDGLQPRVLNLKSLLEEFLAYRRVVVTRRATFDRKRAAARAHILEGLATALDHIDAVITTIRRSATREDAHAELVRKFRFSDAQASAILDMRLATLTGLERKKVVRELSELRALIRELTELLGNPRRITGLVVRELSAVKEKFADARRTRVEAQPLGEFRLEDLIPDEDTVLTVTRGGYVKRLPVTAYRVQRRGGKGVIGMTTKEEDMVDTVLVTRTHSDILFFTNRGRVFAAKAYDLPLASRTAKGQALPNFLSLEGGEAVTACLALPKGTVERSPHRVRGAPGAPAGYLVMATRQGVVKRIALEELASVRRSGLLAIRLRREDALDWVGRSSGKDEVMLVTARGQSIRFRESDARPMGRPAAGVRGIRLRKGDSVIGMALLPAELPGKDAHILVLTAHGYGKRTLAAAYKVQRRGGSGIKTAQVTPKTGPVVGMAVTPKTIGPEATIIVTSAGGQVIRVPLAGISVLGRATQGVRVMRLAEKDTVASFSTFASAGR